MTNEIKQRIEHIKQGKIPERYQQTRAGIAPNDWVDGNLTDILYNKKRAVPKPKEGYWRIGIRSHAKGTFHEYVEDPSTVDMDELYIVKENDLIVNITFAWEHAIALADKNDDGLLVSHRFPTYVFKQGQIPYFYKNIFVKERFKELLALISPGGAGRNRVMSKKDFLQLPCFIPPCEEQQKISEILMQCDKVIELYEKEIDELKKLKKACLRKMFPQKGKDVPELRFAGFTEPWKQRKLGELATSFEYGLNAAAKEFDGENKYIRITDIDDNTHDFIIDDITSPDIALSEADNYKLSEGDILFARTGASVGKTYIYKASDGLVYYAGFLIRARIKGEYNAEFVFQNTLTEKYNKYILATSQRSGQPGVNAQEYAGYEIFLPCRDEQNKISEYFRKIDDIITLHQRKLEEQQKQKKSLMQLLLTGIVRVKL